jgi:hypothetical protein
METWTRLLKLICDKKLQKSKRNKRHLIALTKRIKKGQKLPEVEIASRLED